MRLDTRFTVLLWLAKLSGKAFDPRVSVRALRRGFAETNRRFGLRDPGGIDVRELTIPAGDGFALPARLYRRADAASEALPVLLYFHGGGWVIGELDGYDGFMRYAAHRGRFAVVAVEYRLGPEHRFPRGHEDALDAYAWLRSNAAVLDLDSKRIAVGGDSAGGSLAAGIANYAEARGNERPSFAWLIYPSVDATGRFASRAAYSGNFPLTPASIDWFTRHATNGPDDCRQPLFVPLDAPEPERHPPTYISAAQFDPLVDEGQAYFERLRAAGVRVTYDLRPTLPHAFVNFAGTIPAAKDAVDAGIDATAVALGVAAPKVAAITGAGSGIGRALALELARRGYALALADRDEHGLTETERLVRDRTIVSTHLVDVAVRAQVEAFAAATIATHGRVDVAIHNAGVGVAGDVTEVSIDEMEWLMNINFWGVVYGIKAFLPELLRAPDASLVNISSAFGLVAPPGQAIYAASKFAVRGLSEALREELRGRVHVLTVHPGGIKTNIARSTRIAAAADQALHRRKAATFEQLFLTQPPEKAARSIVDGILQRRDRVLIGADARRLDIISRVLGPLGTRWMLARKPQRARSEAAARESSDVPAAVRP